VFHTLRQQLEKAPGHYNWALADLIAPKQTGLEDYLGAFAVTAGATSNRWWISFNRTTMTIIHHDESPCRPPGGSTGRIDAQARP